ncbi:dNA-binding protein HU [Clostridium sp. CAG:1193]|jgi:DNA-binding protein HU-beta|nr:dNA-binding protein HU [Clostridium sp. CAG:1193]
MSKTDLIEFVAEKAELSKAAAGRAVDAFMEGVTKGLVKEGKVSLVGFLTLEKKKRAARNARNPQTGETVEIPARNAVSVKVGSKLKEAVK